MHRVVIWMRLACTVANDRRPPCNKPVCYVATAERLEVLQADVCLPVLLLVCLAELSSLQCGRFMGLSVAFINSEWNALRAFQGRTSRAVAGASSFGKNSCVVVTPHLCFSPGSVTRGRSEIS